MAGKVTSIDAKPAAVKPLEVISYEISPLFNLGERYNSDDLVGRRGLRIYKEMLVDEQVKAVVQFKRDAITSRGWQFVFSDDSTLADAEKSTRIKVFESSLAQMRGSFVDALNVIARGRAYGFSMTEKVFDLITVEGKRWMGLHSMLARDPTTFIFYTDTYGTLTKIVQKLNSIEVAIDPAKFIHYVHAPEEDRYYGQSDLRSAYRAWYSKDQIIKLYLLWMERFAGGLAVMQAKEGQTIPENSPEHRAIMGILQNIRRSAGMLLPSGVDFRLESPQQTAEFREGMITFDVAIAKSLLVPNLLGLSHTGGTGAYAQSQTQLEAFFWTLNADSKRLEECLNDQLFKDLGRQNWDDNEYPRFQFNPPSQEQIRWMVQTWRELIEAKAVQPTDADEAHIRKLLDMPARADDEENPDEAIKTDPSAAYDSGQISAMLDILDRVAIGKLEREVAVRVLVESFPMSEDDATALVEKVKEREPDPIIGPDGMPLPQAGALPGAKPPGAKPAIAKPAKPTVHAQQFHTPGGHEHDQKTHGGGGGSAEEIEAIRAEIKAHLPDRQVLEQLPIREVKVDDLKPTQSGVNDEKVAGILRADVRTGTGLQPGMVVRYKDQNYIMDGHHRIEAARQRGDKTVPVLYIELTRKIRAHTEHGKPRLVAMSHFLSAAFRVDFAVIDKRQNAVAETAVEDGARLMARATWRLLGDDQRMAELIDADVSDIEFVRLEPADIGRLKSAMKGALSRGWAVGVDASRRELAKLGQATAFAAPSLRAKAAEYFEANGARMAGNLSDGAKAIIQQELQQSVKGGIDVRTTRTRIYDRLIRKGFTTMRALDAETSSSVLLEDVEEALGEALVTSNVPAYLDTLVRTNTYEAMNEARYAEFTDPTLEGFVKAFEYSAIMDERTTDICSQLNGNAWSAESPVWEQYRPPNHYNCRSVLIPITESDGWTGQDSPDPGVTPQDGFK